MADAGVTCDAELIKRERENRRGSTDKRLEEAVVLFTGNSLVGYIMGNPVE
jgi:hypothetical protein